MLTAMVKYVPEFLPRNPGFRAAWASIRVDNSRWELEVKDGRTPIGDTSRPCVRSWGRRVRLRQH
jgi:hypothetical protein